LEKVPKKSEGIDGLIIKPAATAPCPEMQGSYFSLCQSSMQSKSFIVYESECEGHKYYELLKYL
jgi:hypothetical protein